MVSYVCTESGAKPGHSQEPELEQAPQGCRKGCPGQAPSERDLSSALGGLPQRDLIKHTAQNETAWDSERELDQGSPGLSH